MVISSDAEERQTSFKDKDEGYFYGAGLYDTIEFNLSNQAKNICDEYTYSKNSMRKFYSVLVII